MTEIDWDNLPLTTIPTDLGLTVKGFENEEGARELGHAVLDAIMLFGRFMDLSALDGVTVAIDYDQALSDLDRGLPGLRPLTRSNTAEMQGVAMSPAVMRDGQVKTHLVFNPAYSSGSVSRVGGSGVSDCFDVGKWVSRPVLQRGNLCHGPHPPGAMIARRDFRFQRSGARRSQPRSTEVGSPRMAVFCCWHRPSARWGFAGGLRLALPIRGTLCG